MEVLDADYPGETQEGARILVGKVRAAINVRFRNGVAQPDTLWTDRGKGFYSPNNGLIPQGYQNALREHGFKAALGKNAFVQLGKLQELMLHETAVTWIRLRLGRTVPARPWEESRDAYTTRLKRAVEEVNTSCDVEGFCRGFIQRVNQLVAAKGGRLAK